MVERTHLVIILQSDQRSSPSKPLAATAYACPPTVAPTEPPIRPTSICKLLIVGNAKCGKTSIIRRYVDDAFTPVGGLISINGSSSSSSSSTGTVVLHLIDHVPKCAWVEQKYVTTIGADYIKKDVVLQDGRAVRLQVREAYFQ